MKTYLNPLNLNYKYQRFSSGDPRQAPLFREAADPSIVYFKGQYLLFPSMAGGFYSSRDLTAWQFQAYPFPMPVQNYAPDVCTVGDYLYFCASASEANGDFYRTLDPFTQPFEKIPGTFPIWDPHLLYTKSKHLYLYWGCSNVTPIYGVELDPEKMTMIGSPQLLVTLHPDRNGYERFGNDHQAPQSDAQILASVQQAIEALPNPHDMNAINAAYTGLHNQFAGNPWLEGTWVNELNDKFYLQYAVPGTEFNIYADGVYIADKPLGPYVQQKSNPYSYVPGGFMPGAGHGSTFETPQGQLWHIATSQISVNHPFERRVSLWKAALDQSGQLYCDQRFSDWPKSVNTPMFADPKWLLLSFGKPVSASSGSAAAAAVDESNKTFWQSDLADKKPQLTVDLQHQAEVHAVQINFADGEVFPEDAELPGVKPGESRYIDAGSGKTRWLLEGSADGQRFFTLADKTQAETDLPHDYWVDEAGQHCRYLRLTIVQTPFNQAPAISGLRVFGKESGDLPELNGFSCQRLDDLDMQVSWQAAAAIGADVLWGSAPSQLYHSKLVLGQNQTQVGALMRGQEVYVRVDVFNESGVTHGQVQRVSR